MARSFLPMVLIAGMALLTGCDSPSREFSNAHPQLVAEPDSVSAMLADAADRAANSLETLAAVEQSRSPGVAVAPVGWIGPVEPISKTLANRAGYNFIVVGNAPPVPIVVSIDKENLPVIDVLRDVGLQLGMRGDIKVDSAGKVVELHYPPDTGVDQ